MTYKEACDQACEGCREDLHTLFMTHYPPLSSEGPKFTCTAPTRDEHEAGLLTRIAELEADQRRLDWWIDESHQEDFGRLWLDDETGKYFWEHERDADSPPNAILYDSPRAALDAAMKATE